jgi:hypothetical protein
VGGQSALPPGLAHLTYTAVVAANGVLKRGDGATSSGKIGTGIYGVDFPIDITYCAVVPTLGETGEKGAVPAGFITVAGLTSDPKGIFIATYNFAGHRKDFPFHVDVAC